MLFEELLGQINDTGFSVLDPSQRLFWGNILGAAILLLIVPGADRWQRLRILCSKRIWLHRSSRADMKIILGNALLRFLLLPASFLSSLAVAAGVSLLLTYIFGAKPHLDLPPLLTSLLFSIALFLADDFARFYLHYLQHRWPYLWVFHQTHHSALVLTPLTLLRTHPVEILSSRIRNALSYGLVSGVFFYGIGEGVGAWDILGVGILGFSFNLLGANLRHSQVWLHFGPLERIFISPAAHQIHHSADAMHYDKNFGVCLAIWDRIFKTHLDPRGVTAPLTFGLIDSPLSDPKQRLHVLYLRPFVEFCSLLSSSFRKG